MPHKAAEVRSGSHAVQCSVDEMRRHLRSEQQAKLQTVLCSCTNRHSQKREKQQQGKCKKDSIECTLLAGVSGRHLSVCAGVGLRKGGMAA